MPEPEQFHTRYMANKEADKLRNEGRVVGVH
jgi:hypothetical protein